LVICIHGLDSKESYVRAYMACRGNVSVILSKVIFQEEYELCLEIY